MFSKNIYFFLKLVKIIYFFSFFSGIFSSNEYFKKINPYQEEKIYLDTQNPKKFYVYENTKFSKENVYDIIIQIKEIQKQYNDVNIYIYTNNTYFENINNITKVNETNKEFIDYEIKYDINSIYDNYTELSISKNLYNMFFNFYYIVFVKSNTRNNFECNFILFNTLDEIELTPNNSINNFYYRYDNNYLHTNYIFKINPKFIDNNKYLNVQLMTYYENTLFNISIFKKLNENNTYEIYNLNNNNSLDYTIEINDTQIFYLNISYIKINDDNIKNTFTVFFEFLSNYFQKIEDYSININFLSKKDYYLYSIIDIPLQYNNNITIVNNYSFYMLKTISNNEIIINNDYYSVEYLIYNNINDKNIQINNEYTNNIIINNKNNFLKLKSFYDQFKSTTYYKAKINKYENVKKLLIIKISLNDNNIKNKLTIKSIYFRALPLTLLTENIYNNKQSYIQYFSIKNILDGIGYFYVPMKSVNKNKILYCPYENTMNLFFGEFDISDSMMLPSLENQKILVINPYNDTLFNGITILTSNKYNNYFIQYGEIDDSILNNIKINNFISDDKLNKEISINDNIKEMYFFNIYNFNSSFILDMTLIYGNVSMEYLSFDTLSETDKNLYNIFPFNKALLNKKIKKINNPTLIGTSSIEVLRIINNQYINETENSINVNNIIKSLFYIKKYKLYTEIEENQLLPLFISSNDMFSKYKINLNSISGEIKYKFFIFYYNPSNDNNNEYNLSITINNESFFLSKKENNRIHIGVINILRFNQVRITNYGHKNVLIWTQIGNLGENDYEIIYASEKAFNGVMTTGTTYLFVFDYLNIINKKILGLYPYKFQFNLEKPISSKCNGYYFQSLVNSNFIAENFIFSPTNVNSIYYEIIHSGNNISLYDELSFEEFDIILKNKYYLNTLIRQVNGYLIVNFYMEYKYDLIEKKNELVSFQFDESIYTVNFELDQSNQKNYLLFQVLSCETTKDFDVLFFKENTNISYSFFKNDDNGKIEKITKENIFGYININQIKNENLYSNFIKVQKPGKLFIQYLYTNSKVDIDLINTLEDESKYNYNINIEKIRKVENKDIFSISFDCFIKNTITNYFILTLNEQENDITNECQFLSYLYNYNYKNSFFSANNRFLSASITHNKYICFKDEGTNDRISREISFDSYGNYRVYILAEELENYSLYKLLGVKTYSYINDGNNNNEDKKENEVSIILILLIIVLSLLIIILSAFIIYHHVRKENINQIISFINLPSNDSFKSDKKNMILSIINNRNDRNNLNKSQNSLFFPILNDNENIELEEQENKNNNSKDNRINNVVNHNDNKEINNIDYEEEKSEPPPPPITAIPPENKISNMLNEIKKNNGNIYDKEKEYTNDGSGMTNKGE